MSEETKTPTDWTQSFDESTRGYVQNKGFKTAQDLAQSYMNLEKIHSAGPDKLIKLPESMYSDEAKPVWEKLGLPKEPKEYGFDPKTHGEHLADDFYEARITKAQAEKLLVKQKERTEAQQKTMELELQGKAQQARDALKQEWGQAFDKNKTIAQDAALRFGITEDQQKALDRALGTEGTMKFLHGLGTALGEDSFPKTPKGDPNLITPDAAEQKLKELTQDRAFVQRYMDGDTEARKIMENLHRMKTNNAMMSL